MAKLLVGEHDHDFAEFLRDYLIEDAHQVTVVHDGPGLVALAKRHPWDLVVLDWSLHVLTGGWLCAALREHRWASRLPIVALATGLMQRIEAEDEISVENVIPMPVHPNELRYRVRMSLAASSAR